MVPGVVLSLPDAFDPEFGVLFVVGDACDRRLLRRELVLPVSVPELEP